MASQLCLIRFARNYVDCRASRGRSVKRVYTILYTKIQLQVNNQHNIRQSYSLFNLEKCFYGTHWFNCLYVTSPLTAKCEIQKILFFIWNLKLFSKFKIWDLYQNSIWKPSVLIKEEFSVNVKLFFYRCVYWNKVDRPKYRSLSLIHI